MCGGGGGLLIRTVDQNCCSEASLTSRLEVSIIMLISSVPNGILSGADSH